MRRDDLPQVLETTLAKLGGNGTILEVCKTFWADYENELHDSGALFYTWQYDIRWAATTLRKAGIMKDVSASDAGVWELR